ncbi:MAG: c-type cytochrome [Myxococcota bacterium]
MLSKSAARTFFLGGTVLCSGVFIWLTVDTVQQTPARSQTRHMSESVVRGHDVWNDNNCMGCHTLLGEGAYYAPELTKVVERRGKPWIRTFLKDPEAMYPGRRRMVQYDFTEQEISDVVAFLDWVGGIDTNGFPADPIYGDEAKSAGAATKGQAHVGDRPEIFSQLCTACHSLGGSGGNVGPALDGVGARFDDPEELNAWLEDPQSVKPGTAMPDLGLSEAQRDELVTFLMKQK